MKIKKGFLFIVLIAILSNLVFSAYVKVKSPNGGETWNLGSEKTITWEKSGSFTKFRIILRKADKKVGDIAWVNNPNKTSFQWKKVGEYIGGSVVAGNDYKIRIRGYLSTGGNKVDDSLANFTLTSVSGNTFQIGRRNFNVGEQKKITFPTYPTVQNYKTGQLLYLTWKTNWRVGFKETFDLKLFKRGGNELKKYIGKSKPGSTKYIWRIPGDIPQEHYSIEVSQGPTKVRGGRFHISWAYEAKPKTFILRNPKIINSWKIKVRDVTYSTCKGLRSENDGEVPEPDIVRVGNTYYKNYYGACSNRYRGFVYFDLSSVPKDGLLVGAQLKFNKHKGGCPDDARILVLNQKWNESTGLFSIPTSEANPYDFKKVVQKWLNLPNSNYGIVFALLKDRTRCLLFYDNVRLVLKIREKLK